MNPSFINYRNALDLFINFSKSDYAQTCQAIHFFLFPFSLEGIYNQWEIIDR